MLQFCKSPHCLWEGVMASPYTETYQRFYFLPPKEILPTIGGYYRCPREMLPDGTERFLGPLVLYTSKDESGKRHIGFEYVDFTAVSSRKPILHAIAERLYSDVIYLSYEKRSRVLLCGIPTGG